jgi:hypothetical protein
VACESLTLQIFSSNSEMIGCGLEGRLLDRAWKLINIGTVNWLSFNIIFTFKKLNDIKIRGKA